MKDLYGDFTLTAIYCSPANSRAQSFKFFNHVLSINGPHVVAGDYNAKHTAWNNISSCRKGLDLLKLIQSNLFSIHVPDGITSIPGNGETFSVLDFVISKQIYGVTNPHVHNELSLF